jgi:protein-S-isoprenylcysteine O-methyltransferase Ste14
VLCFTLSPDAGDANLLDFATVLRVLFPLIALVVDVLLMSLAVGGFAALRDHSRALALLGVWAVSTLVLSLMRPVGPQDKTRTSPDAPLVMLTLFAVPLLAPPVSAWGEAHGIWTAPWDRVPSAMAGVLLWGGVLVTAAGLAVRIRAMRQLGARFSPHIAVQREHALETGGAYARVRHPGYLGALLATAGAILAFGSILAWPLFAVMLVAQNTRASREEVLLEDHFGESWRAYRAHTGRFVPRLGSRRHVG